MILFPLSFKWYNLYIFQLFFCFFRFVLIKKKFLFFVETRTFFPALTKWTFFFRFFHNSEFRLTWRKQKKTAVVYNQTKQNEWVVFFVKEFWVFRMKELFCSVIVRNEGEALRNVSQREKKGKNLVFLLYVRCLGHPQPHKTTKNKQNKTKTDSTCLLLLLFYFKYIYLYIYCTSRHTKNRKL